eukprot:gene417-373_t
MSSPTVGPKGVAVDGRKFVRDLAELFERMGAPPTHFASATSALTFVHTMPFAGKKANNHPLTLNLQALHYLHIEITNAKDKERQGTLPSPLPTMGVVPDMSTSSPTWGRFFGSIASSELSAERSHFRSLLLLHNGFARVRHLSVSGSSDLKEGPLDVSYFPSLSTLSVTSCAVTSVTGAVDVTELLLENAVVDLGEFANLIKVQMVRCTSPYLRTLSLHSATLQDLTLLQSVQMDCPTCLDPGPYPHSASWQALSIVDLSMNQLTSLKPLFACPSLHRLVARANNLVSLAGCGSHPSLTYLDLRENCLDGIQDLISFAPVVSTLLLAQNNLSSLQGLQGLPMVQTLDLGSNRIQSWSCLRHLKTLGDLVHLILRGNPVASSLSDRQYRVTALTGLLDVVTQRLLERNKGQSPGFYLDDVRVRQQEGMLALQASRKGLVPEPPDSPQQPEKDEPPAYQETVRTSGAPSLIPGRAPGKKRKGRRRNVANVRDADGLTTSASADPDQAQYPVTEELLDHSEQLDTTLEQSYSADVVIPENASRILPSAPATDAESFRSQLWAYKEALGDRWLNVANDFLQQKVSVDGLAQGVSGSTHALNSGTCNFLPTEKAPQSADAVLSAAAAALGCHYTLNVVQSNDHCLWQSDKDQTRIRNVWEATFTCSDNEFCLTESAQQHLVKIDIAVARQVKYLSLSCSVGPLLDSTVATASKFKLNAVHCFNAEPEEEALPLHTESHPWYQFIGAIPKSSGGIVVQPNILTALPDPVDDAEFGLTSPMNSPPSPNSHSSPTADAPAFNISGSQQSSYPLPSAGGLYKLQSPGSATVAHVSHDVVGNSLEVGMDGSSTGSGHSVVKAPFASLVESALDLEDSHSFPTNQYGTPMDDAEIQQVLSLLSPVPTATPLACFVVPSSKLQASLVRYLNAHLGSCTVQMAWPVSLATRINQDATLPYPLYRSLLKKRPPWPLWEQSIHALRLSEGGCSGSPAEQLVYIGCTN